tara:strand:- start:13653 stop:13913 length:261 start_codon:yes stop_codon:yes gene_type:complete
MGLAVLTLPLLLVCNVDELTVSTNCYSTPDGNVWELMGEGHNHCFYAIELDDELVCYRCTTLSSQGIESDFSDPWCGAAWCHVPYE